MADRKKALSYMEQAIGVLEDHSSDCDPEVLSSLDPGWRSQEIDG